MRISIALSPLCAALAAAQAVQMAPKIPDNPDGTVYDAELPKQPFFTAGSLQGNIQGSVRVAAAPNKVGVRYRVHFSNLPKEGGPFLYHIHVKQVPQGGNCTQTEGHLDPTNRGEEPGCDASNPQSCQVGDLSGKYGKIMEDPFVAEFEDPFTSLKDGDAAFVGGRSFAIHFGNKTRITCANFAKKEASQPLPWPLSIVASWQPVIALPLPILPIFSLAETP
ncbi:hypothetical protein HIM_06792 [Hirsutella minnesotensis 3608]|uniref:superoxide dismutase n=1 Tax=Hirsutella minnesotensis 3608 TaxID=1043627 RepID=A0A0F8A4N7_9HYPO|nr:hypothetical protein HIM_06792 [Hirsutella minnesotensis 3608]